MRYAAQRGRSVTVGIGSSVAAVMLPVLAITTCEIASAAPTLSPLALSCQGCHRPGSSSTEFVGLNRLSAASIRDALQRSRDQPDPGAIMSRFAAKLSDGQIGQLAAELSAPPAR